MHRRLRRSTVALCAIFVVALVLYLLVRPDPASLPARDSTPTLRVPTATTTTTTTTTTG